jgi:hypothetical protein
MNTDDFDIGQRVKVNSPGHFLHDMTATVVERDAYTVEIRFDTITEKMRGFEDTRKGLASVEPQELIKI